MPAKKTKITHHNRGGSSHIEVFYLILVIERIKLRLAFCLFKMIANVMDSLPFQYFTMSNTYKQQKWPSLKTYNDEK